MNCLACGKELVKGQIKFCSSAHQAEYNYRNYIARWLIGEESGSKGNYGVSGHVRKYLMEINHNACQKCGWSQVNTFTNSVPLEIHHISDENFDNSLSNLQLLCPNCHSLTANFRSRGAGRKERRQYTTNKNKVCIDCGIAITNSATRCRSCAGKVSQKEMPITREELKKRIRTETFTSIAQSFNLSNAMVVKWCKKYQLPHTKKEINSISNEDWIDI